MQSLWEDLGDWLERVLLSLNQQRTVNRVGDPKGQEIPNPANADGKLNRKKNET
jgi:hypothetical protein